MIAQSSGSVRIIVTFANPAAADEIKSNPSALQTVQAEVARTQNAMIATHFGSADAPREGAGFPRAIRRFPITPGFAVNVNPAELDALLSDASVAGTADFNGDGKGDIFWREAGGSNAIWLMNGAAIASVNLVGSVGTNWSIQNAAAN